MRPVLSIDAIRQTEVAANEQGISYAAMMQQAGAAIATKIEEHYLGVHAPEIKILMLIGQGNNGGDALVAARRLAEKTEAHIIAYLLNPRDPADPLIHAIENTNITIINAANDPDYAELTQHVRDAYIIVDALYGIGARIPLPHHAAKLLQHIHKLRAETDLIEAPIIETEKIELRAPQATIIAIDCPSGLDCDTGKIDQNALIADQTITFIAAKHGQFLLPGANHVGELIIVPLDIPQHVETRHTIATGQTIQRLLKPRNPSAHKGTSGKALIIGGSSQYIGAVGLAAEAAYRIGAGLVTVATTNPVIQALSAQLLEPIWLQLPNHMGAISENASRIIRTEAAKANAVLLGPGIGRAKTTELTLKHLFDAPLSAALNRPSMGFGRNNIPHTDIDTPAQFPPLVIDADALYLLSQIDKWWKKLPTPHTILTPHPGEMAQLAGVSVAHIQRNRWKVAQSRAAAWGVTLVLKGANTLIATPEGDVTVIPFKTPALATAGTGDILAGMIVGLLAQGYNTQHAAIIAAYLHGLAGKERQVVYGTRGTIAQDILRNALLNALEKVESRDTIY